MIGGENMDEKLWPVFKDRVKSLLERWDSFKAKHPEWDDKKCIKACLDEINDEFTQAMIE
jgi:hypothetical protein